MTDINNPQKFTKGKYKNKDIVDLIKERLAEIHTSMSALTCRVDGIDKCIKKLKPKEDMEEL